MPKPQRLVADTNVLISHLLIPGSVPDQAVRTIFKEHRLLRSEATTSELANVLLRPKFDRFVARSRRVELLAAFEAAAEIISIADPIRACRDPRDDKFLELAVNGAAHCLITGDADLLALHPFRSVAILIPAAWLAQIRS